MPASTTANNSIATTEVSSGYANAPVLWVATPNLVGVLVPSLEKRLDGRLWVGHAEKDAAANGLVVQLTEPSLRRDSSNWNSWGRRDTNRA